MLSNLNESVLLRFRFREDAHKKIIEQNKKIIKKTIIYTLLWNEVREPLQFFLPNKFLIKNAGRIK